MPWMARQMIFALLKEYIKYIFLFHNLTFLKFLFCEWFVVFSSLSCICKLLIYYVVIMFSGIMVYRENKDAVRIWCLSIYLLQTYL